MANGKEKRQATPAVRNKSETLAIFKRIETGPDVKNLMSSVICDLVKGAMTPQVANALCNEGGMFLKVFEMQRRHGKAASDRRKASSLASGRQTKQASEA
jgi:hypothetical protein